MRDESGKSPASHAFTPTQPHLRSPFQARIGPEDGWIVGRHYHLGRVASRQAGSLFAFGIQPIDREGVDNGSPRRRQGRLRGFALAARWASGRSSRDGLTANAIERAFVTHLAAHLRAASPAPYGRCPRPNPPVRACCPMLPPRGPARLASRASCGSATEPGCQFPLHRSAALRQAPHRMLHSRTPSTQSL
jgi:hypothetical protein